MPTQLERAQKLIRENFLQANVLDGTADQGPAFMELAEIMHAAQNPPPEGGSDGSFDEETWIALMEAVRGIRDLSASFRRIEQSFDKVLAKGTIGKRVARLSRRPRLTIPVRKR